MYDRKEEVLTGTPADHLLYVHDGGRCDETEGDPAPVTGVEPREIRFC